MSAEARRKRGAPKGHQSASKPGTPEKKHGFYSKVLNEAEQLDFELAAGVDGIDDEIALLRVKIKSILEHDPENIKHITEVTNALARLVKTRYDITREQRKGLKEAIGNVLRDVALPLSIGIGAGINRQ
ncbi:hypothetical protein ACFLYR_03740 [Chloroflexota bacterium]